MSASRRRWFRVVTVVLVIAASLLLAEIAVRVLFRYNSPRTVRENSLRYLPTVYSRHLLAPDQQADPGRAWGSREDTGASAPSFMINDRGYRGKSFAVPKPDGIRRVVILGGSAVFDKNALEGRDWPHLVETYLAEGGASGVEVINAGVPGHASIDSVGRLVTQAWTFEPDFVLLYNAWNDVKTFRQLSRERPLISLVQPHDPEANPFMHERNLLDRVLCHSQLYVKVRTRLLMWRLDVGEEGSRSGLALDSGYDPLALEQYRLNVELFVDAARSTGATPILLTQATLLAKDNTEQEKARIAYGYQGLDHDALVDAMDDCNEVVRAVATDRDVALLDLARRFSGKTDLFADHVHTTERGSEEVARAVASFLDALIRSDARAGEGSGG